MSIATMIATVQALPAGPWQEEVDWMEWRADLLGDSLPERFRDSRVKALYSLRSALEGGQGPTNQEERTRRLRTAAGCFDYVQLEGSRDLDPALLQAIPPHRRLISWHGQVTEPETLQKIFASFERTEALLYRFVAEGDEVLTALAPLQFLAALQRSDVIAYAESGQAAWTRPLAARCGAPVVFGDIGSHSSAELSALRRDYGLPDLHRVTELCAIVGRPVQASLSPQLHNAAYRAQGAARLFLRLPVPSFDDFWQGIIEPSRFEKMGLSLAGITVASPHKNAALGVAEEVSAISRTADSANLLLRRGPAWHADSTDASGVLMNLAAEGLSCAGRRMAVIGCGGSGRPIAAALRRSGAQVTLVNRSVPRGRWAAGFLGLPFTPLAELRPADFDLLVNATPVGREGEELPVNLAHLPRGSVIVDLVLSSSATPLAAEGRRCGHTVIDGREILLAQASCQYLAMTGEKMPQQRALAILGLTASDGPSRPRKRAAANERNTEELLTT